MQVTTKISVDLIRANVGTRVNAVQGDGNTRYAEITLLADGKQWEPPEGVEAAIAYRQPGGAKGLYNQLADGTTAISISGNVATVILAPQMLTASGTVQASLVFNDQQLNRLTTFPFAVSVASIQPPGHRKPRTTSGFNGWRTSWTNTCARRQTAGRLTVRRGREVSKVFRDRRDNPAETEQTERTVLPVRLLNTGLTTARRSRLPGLRSLRQIFCSRMLIRSRKLLRTYGLVILTMA